MPDADDSRFPPCPFLPDAEVKMDYRNLRKLRGGPGEALYEEALRYAQYLWQRKLPARAILALGRAFYVDLPHESEILQEFPPPYAALAWFLQHYQTETGAFLGNPRLSFQHQALRLGGRRSELRRWRAWAANAVVRAQRPDLAPDEKIQGKEPEPYVIAEALSVHGVQGEAEAFEKALMPPGAIN